MVPLLNSAFFADGDASLRCCDLQAKREISRPVQVNLRHNLVEPLFRDTDRIFSRFQIRRGELPGIIGAEHERLQ